MPEPLIMYLGGVATGAAVTVIASTIIAVCWLWPRHDRYGYVPGIDCPAEEFTPEPLPGWESAHV